MWLFNRCDSYLMVYSHYSHYQCTLMLCRGMDCLSPTNGAGEQHVICISSLYGRCSGSTVPAHSLPPVNLFSFIQLCNLILNSWLKWQSPQRKTSQIRSQRAGPTLKGNWQSISWYCFIGLSVSARTGKPATWRKAAGGTPTAQRAGKGTSSISRTVRSSSRRSGTCARWGAHLWKTRKPTKRG